MTRALILALALTGCAGPERLPFSHCVNERTGQDLPVVGYEVDGFWSYIQVRDRNGIRHMINAENSDQWECR